MCDARSVGTSGEKPIPVMFQAYLEGFYNWAQQECRSQRADAKFKRFVKTMLETFVKEELESTTRLLPKARSATV